MINKPTLSEYLESLDQVQLVNLILPGILNNPKHKSIEHPKKKPMESYKIVIIDFSKT